MCSFNVSIPLVLSSEQLLQFTDNGTIYLAVTCSHYSENETSGLETLKEHIMNEVRDFLTLVNRIQIKSFRNAEKLSKNKYLRSILYKMSHQ